MKVMRKYGGYAWRRLLLSLLAFVVLSSAQASEAQCREGQSATTALRLQHCDVDGVEYWVLRADLAAGDLGIQVSRPNERHQRPDEWTRSVPGLVAAIPAGDFRFPSYTPIGLTIGQGQHWANTEDNGELGVLAFDNRGLAVLAPANQLVPVEPWMRNVISGVQLVREGVAIDGCVGQGCQSGARTGLGLDESGRFLIAVSVRGRGSRGADDPMLARLLRNAGAQEAIRVSAGASSFLWSGTMRLDSSDGSPRIGAAYLGLVDRETGLETRLRGVVGVEGQATTLLPNAKVWLETVDGRRFTDLELMGPSASWEHSVPVREYIVRAEHQGYRRGCRVCIGVPSQDVWCSIFLKPGPGEERCEVPPRTLEVGPWPEESTISIAQVQDGGVEEMQVPESGCQARGTSWSAALALMLLALRRRRGVR